MLKESKESTLKSDAPYLHWMYTVYTRTHIEYKNENHTKTITFLLFSFNRTNGLIALYYTV